MKNGRYVKERKKRVKRFKSQKLLKLSEKTTVLKPSGVKAVRGSVDAMSSTVRKSVQEVSERSRRRGAKALRAQSVSELCPPKTPSVCRLCERPDPRSSSQFERSTSKRPAC